jgi:hypothetical protein
MANGGKKTMVWQAQWESPLASFLGDFDELIGDRRTRFTFRETVKGMIAAGSLICQRIAAQSQVLGATGKGGQRIIRLAKGESTKRSQLDADSVTEQVRRRGLSVLAEAGGEELWLVVDGSDLRKPHAQMMPDLMKVKDLDGKLVPGYRTLNVLGMTPQRRGLLYHRLFSSQEAEFSSEPAEVQLALQTVHEALPEQGNWQSVTWIMDRGFDDVAVWRTVWEQEEHLVCRVKHSERLVEYQAQNGSWLAKDIAAAVGELRPYAQVQTEMVVRRGRQPQPKAQRVTADIRACPLRLTYEGNVRRPGLADMRRQDLWLVEVHLLGTSLEPWLLLTDWPVQDAESAVRIFRMYRQRWAVEDAFKFTKECLGWEDVQLLNLAGIRTLVALAWVAAAFLYELGVGLEWPEVQLLARLGGWEYHKDRKPGKTTLTRGLRRILDMLTTEAFLSAYIAEHGELPPHIAALLDGWSPTKL